MPKRISLVLPIYNESLSLSELFLDITKIIATETNYEFEIIFVNDGSTDDSLPQLVAFQTTHSLVKVIALTRNFGKEMALTAGVNESSGEACIMMDADLQHPVQLISEFLQKWEQGAEVVVGVKNKNREASFVKRIGSYFFYKIINAISDTNLKPNATDFRLIDKKVVEIFKTFTEHERITRGLIDWLGFKTEYIDFDCGPRKEGSKAGYSFFKLFRLAMSTFIAHSLFPLKLAGYIGILITISSFGFGSFVITEQFILGDPWHLSFSGSAMLAILVIFLVGIVLISLGLTALYISQIHSEVMNRPLYVVRKKYESITKL